MRRQPGSFHSLEEQIRSAPLSPGVYIFRDADGNPLYVGKARSLRMRLLHYLQGKGTSPKTRAILREAVSVDVIVTQTEEEAFLLEYSLIKKLSPRFNVVWRDGKSFPYICIRKEPFPRVLVMRRPHEDGSEYYGPFSSKQYLDELMETLRFLFPLRTCSYHLTPENIARKKFRKCLEYHMGRCRAPCEGLQSEEEYLQMIEDVRNLLRGNVQHVVKRLQEQIRQHVENMEFEQAYQLREKIRRIERLRERVSILRGTQATVDVYAYRRATSMAFVHYLQIVQGVITVSHTLRLVYASRKARPSLSSLDETDEDLLRQAILETRERFQSRAREIVVPFPVQLPVSEITVHSVSPEASGSDIWQGLMQIAERNLEAFIERNYPDTRPDIHPALPELQKILDLPAPPITIECLDISTLSGRETTASVVVFRKGKPVRREYRHYLIRTLAEREINDYQAIREVVMRRYRRLQDEGKPLPDLILIDGGAGQAGIAHDVLQELQIQPPPPVYGLAKRLEILYRPHDARNPIYLDRRSVALLLLQQIRNEAHRFANRLREKRLRAHLFQSLLEEVPGIGRKRARLLLERYGSLEEIRKVPVEDLSALITEPIARLLKEWLEHRYTRER